MMIQITYINNLKYNVECLTEIPAFNFHESYEELSLTCPGTNIINILKS